MVLPDQLGNSYQIGQSSVILIINFVNFNFFIGSGETTEAEWPRIAGDT